ncbi:AI-2E family transporter [Salibacterium aidingense]|uniref:AI-2E family transporter n=1 Tax=Salibacterium aidingense TaxID=384933 RepID=UPI003BCF5B3E
MDSKKEWRWIKRLVFTAVFFIILYLLYLLSPVWSPVLQVSGKVLLPFLLAGIIAYLLHPIIDFFQKLHVPRSLSILFVYIVFFGGGSWLVWYYSPVLYEQLNNFINSLPQYFDQMYKWFTNLHHHVDRLPPVVHDNIELAFHNAEKRVSQTLHQLLGKWRDVFDFAVILILLPFLVFYLLKDYKALEKMVKRLTPEKWREEGHLLAVSIDESLGSYIRGQFIVAGAVGILSTLVLVWLDIPNAVMLGLFIGITDIIPYFGPILGAVPALIAAGSVSTKMTVLTAVALFVIQQVEGNFLSPYIVGRNVHLHPLVIVFALLLGFEAAGVIGLLIAVPIFVVINNITHTFQTYKEGSNGD